MSRAISAGDPESALRAQNRTMMRTIALAAPFFKSFFRHARTHRVCWRFSARTFTLEEAHAAARVLAAYDIGLLAIVLIASARASFQARGDTTTPMIALARRRRAQRRTEARPLQTLRRGGPRLQRPRRRLDHFRYSVVPPEAARRFPCGRI